MDIKTITISNLCNMNCSYCYVNKNNIYTISDKQLIDEIDDFIDNKIYAIEFLGGEPILLTNKLLKAIEKLKTAKHKFIFIIYTNALIYNEKIIKELEKVNFKVILFISIDGNKINHDKNRIDKLNNGTYERVKINSKKLLESKIPVKIAQLTTHDNQGSLLENLKTLVQIGFKNINIGSVKSKANLDYLIKEFENIKLWMLNKDKLRIAPFNYRYIDNYVNVPKVYIKDELGNRIVETHKKILAEGLLLEYNNLYKKYLIKSNRYYDELFEF